MMQTLAEYIESHKCLKGLAYQTGMSYDWIRRMSLGQVKASIEAATLIEIATKCEVKAESLLDDKKITLMHYLRGNHAPS